MSLIVPSPMQATEEEIEYPSSDGEPMGETTLHVRALLLLLQAMDDALATVKNVFIAGNVFWYWEKGNVNARRAPDLMVVKNVPRGDRRSFFSWTEIDAVPCTIVAISSQSRWRSDLFEKRKLYARLGVHEYFLFDPEALYLRPALQGFRLDERGIYVPLEPDADNRLQSDELGLLLRAEGALLRLIDATTGAPVLTTTELNERVVQQAKRIAELEELLRDQAQGGSLP